MGDNLFKILDKEQLKRIGYCIDTINDNMKSITSEYHNSNTYMSQHYIIEKLKPILNDVNVLSNILGMDGE